MEIVLWFQSWRTPLVTTAALFFHYVGSAEFALALICLVYWCIDERFGRWLTLLFMVNVWLSSWLKELWHSLRPYEVSEQVKNIVVERSYGIPSAHTQNATMLWGAIALRVRRRWVTVVVALYIILVAISRIVLGVHFLQDVVVGIVVGLLLLTSYVWLRSRIGIWVGQQGVWAQIGIVIISAGALLALHQGLLPPTTTEGAAFATVPVAVFLGGGIGFVVEMHSLKFSASGVWWKRIIRLLVGLGILVVLRSGLDLLFENVEPEWISYLIRYGLIGFWAGYGAPLVFVRVGLSGTQQPVSEMQHKTV